MSQRTLQRTLRPMGLSGSRYNWWILFRCGCRHAESPTAPPKNRSSPSGYLVDFMIQFSERDPGVVIRCIAFREAVSQAKTTSPVASLKDWRSDLGLLPSRRLQAPNVCSF